MTPATLLRQSDFLLIAERWCDIQAGTQEQSNGQHKAKRGTKPKDESAGEQHPPCAQRAAAFSPWQVMEAAYTIIYICISQLLYMFKANKEEDGWAGVHGEWPRSSWSGFRANNGSCMLEKGHAYWGLNRAKTVLL